MDVESKERLNIADKQTRMLLSRDDIMKALIDKGKLSPRTYNEYASTIKNICEKAFMQGVLFKPKRFNEDLSDLQKAIRQKQGRKLFSFFSRTRSIRKKIIEAGQN